MSIEDGLRLSVDTQLWIPLVHIIQKQSHTHGNLLKELFVYVIIFGLEMVFGLRKCSPNSLCAYPERKGFPSLSAPKM